MITPFARIYLRRSITAMLLFATFETAGAQATRPLLIGDIVSSETGGPLAHAMVTILDMGRQTFTSDGGVFAFASVDPGKYRIRAIHIGFSPTDITVEVPANGPPPRVRIELKRLSVQLQTVKVVAANRCTAPGRPNPDVEPDFAAIVGQIRMNAEQYRLLADSFPFQYKVQREFYSLKSDSSRTNERFESDGFRSNAGGWEYKMGDIIGRGRDGRIVMHLPTLSDFASYEFLNNHCFTYGGLDTTRDGVLIRIGFQADIQIRTPDVSGNVYLDAKTYQIRRAELRLTKIPAELSNATAITATTIFGEVSPSIDVIQQVRGLTSIKHHGWGSYIANGEDQRMLELEWLNSNPAHPPPSQP